MELCAILTLPLWLLSLRQWQLMYFSGPPSFNIGWWIWSNRSIQLLQRARKENHPIIFFKTMVCFLLHVLAVQPLTSNAKCTCLYFLVHFRANLLRWIIRFRKVPQIPNLNQSPVSSNSNGTHIFSQQPFHPVVGTWKILLSKGQSEFSQIHITQLLLVNN